ncbi:MAG: hypothetical protein IBX56_20230 [Methylomicrobium sp.]|nr:hypothetical protein [Methylomicrobium sp.]
MARRVTLDMLTRRVMRARRESIDNDGADDPEVEIVINGIAFVATVDNFQIYKSGTIEIALPEITLVERDKVSHR